MPEAWKDYVLNVPGMFSSEAFTYLHHLYLDKVVHARDGEDNPIKKQVAALFAQCWAKGGGAEGKAPKSWRDKYGLKASSSNTPSLINVYMGSMNSPHNSESESIMPF
ncbi:hypothetical protein BT96DRAFT_938110 [Gymnopus androsaceus JB14]|uniref:Uncharacterized protein n=1 Tax=Gymnopus androsaceus JB14 TaxID=1447944 RepID=A0A6A4HQ23_9AGAR|nr:hypothetical protein BT96DRAFT_938110 [Gymnopus androsaceus JB14]